MSDKHTTTIVAAQEAHVAPQPVHPLALEAMQRGLDPDTLERLMGLQERWEANEARKAYARAMVALKRELPSVIEHDGTVDYQPRGKDRVHYTHATLAGVMRVIDPILTRNGFTVTYQTESKDRLIQVTCRVTHSEGHFEDTGPVGAQADSSGGKNGAQGIASTITYLRRYLVLTALGIATADMKGEPQGPQVAEADAIDPQRNMRAMRAVAKAGFTKDEAEEHVGRPVPEWTTADLRVVRDWLNSATDKPDPATGELTPEEEERMERDLAEREQDS